MTSGRLRQNLNVLFFQCALTVQIAQKFKSSEPATGHVTHKINSLYFTTTIGQKPVHKCSSSMALLDV